MAFNYEKDTKRHYQSPETAKSYYESYAAPINWHRLRSNLVALRERRIISDYLGGVPHQKILDLPTGTGKLAPIFKTIASNVKACDISENMLTIARQEYERCEVGATFHVCDAENFRQCFNDRFEVAICLRLLHRVPNEVKVKILREFALAAKYLIVSFGVNSRYQQLRRNIRNFFMGGETASLCSENLGLINKMISNNFKILNKKWVIPIFSQEIIFLLESKMNPKEEKRWN